MFLSTSYEIGRRLAYDDFEKTAAVDSLWPYIVSPLGSAAAHILGEPEKVKSRAVGTMLGTVAGGLAGISPALYTALRHRKEPLVFVNKMLRMTKRHPALRKLPLYGSLAGSVLGYIASKLTD